MTTIAEQHLDIPMRPSDKDNEVCDLEELFQQYVETDLLSFSDNTAEPSGSDDLAHLFELHSSNESDPFEPSPMPNGESSSDSWHKALSTFDQNVASPTIPPNSTSIYPESAGRASLSDPAFFQPDDLLALEHTVPRRPRSTPSTPKPRPARPSKKNLSTPDHTNWKRIEKPAKRVGFVTKMMRSSNFRTGIHDLWNPKADASIEGFNMPLSPHEIPSSPPSAKFSRDEKLSQFVPREQPYMFELSSPSVEGKSETHQHANYQLTPLASPAVDMNGRHGGMNSSFHFGGANMGTANLPNHMSNAALSALQTPPSTQSLPMGTWGPDTSPAQLDFDFSASPDFQQNTWWNSQPTTPYTAQHSRSHSHGQTMAMTTASVAGLGISCDTASFSSFGPELGSQNHGGAGAHHTNGFAAPPSASSFEMPSSSSYPVFPTSPGGIHIGQPQPPSRSPSHSPPIPQPRFTRRRHSSHNRHASPHHHAQHKSSRKSASRKSSYSSASHSSKSHGGGGGGAGGQIGGFVNFTPDDSRKILTGVAPSGSSKTKARREKEAAEKRRKISQVAMQAIIDAGGDVRKLEEGGLLSLEVE